MSYVNAPDHDGRNRSLASESGSYKVNNDIASSYSPPPSIERTVSNTSASTSSNTRIQSSYSNDRYTSQPTAVPLRHKSSDSTSTKQGENHDSRTQTSVPFIYKDPTTLVTSREGAESPDLFGSDNDEKSSVKEAKGGDYASGDSHEMPEKLWETDSASAATNQSSEASQNSERYNHLFAVSGESDISNSYNPLSPLGGSYAMDYRAKFSDSSNQSISEDESNNVNEKTLDFSSSLLSPSANSLPIPHTPEAPRPHNTTAAPRVITGDRNAPIASEVSVTSTKEPSNLPKRDEFDLDGDLLASFDDQYRPRTSKRDTTPPPESSSRPTGKKASLRNILNAQKSKVNIPTGVIVQEMRSSEKFPKYHASSTLSRKHEYDEKRQAAAKKEAYKSEDSMSELSDASSGRGRKPMAHKREKPQSKEKSNLEKNIESIMKTLPPQVASAATGNLINSSTDVKTHREAEHSPVKPFTTEEVSENIPSEALPIFETQSNEHVSSISKPNSTSRSRASSRKSEASFKSVSPIRGVIGVNDGNYEDFDTTSHSNQFEERERGASNPGSEWCEPDDVSVSAAEDNV